MQGYCMLAEFHHFLNMGLEETTSKGIWQGGWQFFCLAQPGFDLGVEAGGVELDRVDGIPLSLGNRQTRTGEAWAAPPLSLPPGDKEAAASVCQPHRAQFKTPHPCRSRWEGSGTRWSCVPPLPCFRFRDPGTPPWKMVAFLGSLPL